MAYFSAVSARPAGYFGSGSRRPGDARAAGDRQGARAGHQAAAVHDKGLRCNLAFRDFPAAPTDDDHILHSPIIIADGPRAAGHPHVTGAAARPPALSDTARWGTLHPLRVRGRKFGGTDASRPLSPGPLLPGPDAAGAAGQPLAPPGRAGDLDQARRLHGGRHRRQQGAQAGMAGRRGAGPGRRPPGHPGRGAVQPRAPDRGGGPQAGHEVHRAAGAPGGDQRPRLPEQRQRVAGPAVRLRHRIPPDRPGHERGSRGQGPGAARGRREAVCDPGRRLQPGGRAGLRVLRAGADAAGRRDGPAHRPHRHRHRQRRHACRAGGRAAGLQRQRPGAGHRRAQPEGPAGGRGAQAGRGHRRVRGRPRRHPARVGGGELRLHRRRLRPADRGHEGGGPHAGPVRGRAAGPGLFRQGDGRADRPGPQGTPSAKTSGSCSSTPAARWACSVIPGCSRGRREPDEEAPLPL